MKHFGKFSHLLVSFFFLTTISLDSVAHATHHDVDHELECPFSNNNLIEAEAIETLNHIDFSPVFVDAFTQSFYFKQENNLFDTRAPPII